MANRFEVFESRMRAAEELARPWRQGVSGEEEDPDEAVGFVWPSRRHDWTDTPAMLLDMIAKGRELLGRAEKEAKEAGKGVLDMARKAAEEAVAGAREEGSAVLAELERVLAAAKAAAGGALMIGGAALPMAILFLLFLRTTR